MEWIAGILFLLYGLYRADLSIYQFNDPVVMYREPKEDRLWVLMNSNSMERFYSAFAGLSRSTNKAAKSFKEFGRALAKAYSDKH